MEIKIYVILKVELLRFWTLGIKILEFIRLSTGSQRHVSHMTCS